MKSSPEVAVPEIPSGIFTSLSETASIEPVNTTVSPSLKEVTSVEIEIFCDIIKLVPKIKISNSAFFITDR